MVVYIAGPLFTKEQRSFLEAIDVVCKSLGFQTFLPHRDVGLIVKGKSPKDVFLEDEQGLDKTDVMVAVLSGPDVDSGTAWEMGYAFANEIKIFGVVTDDRLIDGFLNPMISESIETVYSIEELSKRLKELQQ